MRGLILVDHGSRRAEANDMMICMANLVQTLAGDQVIVKPAHMELASPTIADAFGACVQEGATHVTVFPYMLSPGRHSTSDIPRLVEAAAVEHPGTTYDVTLAFGVHEKLGELILMRAGIPLATTIEGNAGDRCWDPAHSQELCGGACRARSSIEDFANLPE